MGIGSFVTLAAASCSKAVTSNPGNPSNPDKPNNPDTGNTNPGGDTDAKQLADAKASLNTLLGSQSTNVALYEDYAKIKDTLSSAYASAQTTANNANATLKDVNDAKAALQTAISDAANAKTEFDKANLGLVSAYAKLKETLKSETTNLDGLSQDNYSAIKANLVSLYNKAKDFTTVTLDPTSGMIPKVDEITSANTAITQAVSAIDSQKTNADTAATTFIKEKLDSAKLTPGTTAEGQQAASQQPGNYSFVGFSNDVTTGRTGSQEQDLPSWNFAKRKVWTTEGLSAGQTQLVSSETPLTDVSWIYSLTGAGSKYTLTFTYYGPSTAYLYFPYKLVQSSDSNKIGLQYKLNNSETLVPITFGNETNDSGATPAIDDIKVEKVTLSNLNFGDNTIEFSVATEENKVAPMIGNMYLTSSTNNVDKIYDSIFGNTTTTQDNSSKSVTVDLLKGYSLASGWSTYVGRFMNLTSEGQQLSAPVYLVGFIGGNNPRSTNNPSNPVVVYPSTRGKSRTFTIYVNAPIQGQYFISGSYISGAQKPRGLEFSTTGSNNTLSFSNLKQSDWTTLGTFDSNTTATETSGNTNKTLTLSKGLNKITIKGSGADDAPFIGNLKFTLSSQTPSANVGESGQR